MKDSVRLVADSFFASVEADVTVDAIEVGGYVAVTDRPVVADSIETFSLEVVGSETKRYAAPVIRASAEHSRAPPEKACARCDRVRLTFDFPSPIARVEFSERAGLARCPSARTRVVRDEHFAIARAVERAAGFEHDDISSGFRERVRRYSPACAGADNDYIVNFPGSGYLRHLHDTVRGGEKISLLHTLSELRY